MEGDNKDLFLIMTDSKYRYRMYRIGDKQISTADETSILDLRKPVLKMKKSVFPNFMEFTAIGSRMFMVGGHGDDLVSDKVFIYDVVSTKLEHGPSLNSGKLAPFLITLGSKLFVLSHNIYRGEPKSDILDCQPLFEVMDTVDIKRGWTVLPAPSLHTSYKNSRYSVTSCAAVYVSGGNGNHCGGGAIFISGGDDGGGTYAYDVDREEWNYVSDQQLPFYGEAITFPNEPSLCFANSLKSGRYSAFRFCYGGDEEYQVQEIDMTVSPLVFPSLPSLTCFRPMKTVFSNDGSRVYFVMTGVDKALSYHNAHSNRYVKVAALKLSNPTSNDGHSLKRCDKRKRQIEHGDCQDEFSTLDLKCGQLLKRCANNKRQMEHDEGKNETIEVDLDKGQTSRSRKKKKEKKEKMRQVQEQGEEETKELTMSSLWRACFFGGPVCDELIHVAGAFAM